MPSRVTVLAGGVGGAKFVLGLRDALPDAAIDVVVNTGDDMWLAGMRVCPDLDSLLYALAGVNDTERGWGRANESERVAAELIAFGVGWPWFTLGDLDIGTHLARSAMLRDGDSLTEATARLSQRWQLGARLLPVTDEEVPTMVHVQGGIIHFEEWWVRHRAALPALKFEQQGVAAARITTAAAASIGAADLIIVAPSNPVVSIGTILGIPGVREALADTSAPVVGVSPIIGTSAVRGMAAECLDAIGVEVSALGVARHYGARPSGVLDAWLVDSSDAAAVSTLRKRGIRAAAAPLWLRGGAESAAVASAAVALGFASD